MTRVWTPEEPKGKVMTMPDKFLIVIDTQDGDRLIISLGKRVVCDFYGNGYERSLVIEVVTAIAEALSIPVSSVGDPPDPDDLSGGFFVIWSEEHRAWRCPGERGYTNSLCRAGRYTEDRAKEIEQRANQYLEAGSLPDVALPDPLRVSHRGEPK